MCIRDRDIVKNNLNGLLFNNDHEMERAIIKIIKNEKLSQKLSNNALKLIKDYSIESTSAKLMNIYKNELYSKKVSVVIPTYKEEKFIEKTLRAVAKQTYPNYEIVVVDSNSPDRTRQLAKKYTKKVFNLKQRGISKGRNYGARHSDGDIILFLDADTIIEPDFLMNMTRVFRRENVAGASGYVKTTGKAINRLIFMLCSEVAWVFSKIKRPMFYGMCVAVRRDVYNKIGGFNEKLHTAEDIEFTRDMSKYGKCILSRDAIAYTSPRRVTGMGTFNAVMFHIKNFVNYSLFRKSAKDYPVAR